MPKFTHTHNGWGLKRTSPIVALTSLKALLAIATEQDIEIKQLDINFSFLYGNLNEDIYFE